MVEVVAAEMGSFCCFSRPREQPDESDSEETPLFKPPKEPSKPESPVVQPKISKPWYHGSISKEEAEYRLESVSTGLRAKGTFLVYFDSSGYVLLVFKKRLHRCRIRDRGGSKFVLEVESADSETLNPESHSSVTELVKYHKGLSGKPIKLSRTESVKLRDYATVP